MFLLTTSRLFKNFRVSFVTAGPTSSNLFDVLKMAKEFAPAGTLTKVHYAWMRRDTNSDHKDNGKRASSWSGCYVTFGQYMRPTKKHMAVSEHVTPEAFTNYRELGEEMGFRYVGAGSMVRSSYKGGEYFIKNMSEADRENKKTVMGASS